MNKLFLFAWMGAAMTIYAGDWQPLFDGKTLNGWEGATNGYRAEDGILKCMKQGGGKIVTSRDYSDFEVEFDFKLTPGANNGLGIRCKLAGDAAYDGMEIQILDDTAPQYAQLHDYQYHGSISALFQPDADIEGRLANGTTNTSPPSAIILLSS